MTKFSIDRDQLHSERVASFVDRLESDSYEDLNEESLFVSEYVDETIGSPKTLLPNYNFDRILAQLPYNDVIYVTVCPECIQKSDFNNFKTLVERKAITPILTAPYSRYSENIADFVYSHHHVNSYEYHAYRYFGVTEIGPGRICSHCVSLWEKNTKRSISRSINIRKHRDDVDRIIENLYPFISPDNELLDEFKYAVKSKNSEQISHVTNMSETIYSIRTAQVFNSPINIDGKDIATLPTGVTSDIDEAITISSSLDMEVAKGLGLKIPTDIDINSYLDIVENFRPLISREINRITSQSKENIRSDFAEIQREIMNINAEVERIAKSRRYMLLEACSGFYGKNAALANAALFAGAFGLAGSLAGCIGGPAASGAVGAATSGLVTLAKKNKWVSGGPAVDRLSDKISSDLQPFLAKMTALYVGASTPAVNVMSLRTQIEKSTKK
ncbi:hypothetical protein PMI01_01643 [Caulobacter sp. AP07]|uniref:hypothetical protein n=1 Tax=Caulobacter sp. AP07 TaxID=1144304 RepID=UPI00027224FF|nr:hypothetical protein [Caulobacter sp. AP07]EJL34435.1 hypothetical protein PMI01_01643 [Caulobacter sp. AP07]